jgi:hypothetical protein
MVGVPLRYVSPDGALIFIVANHDGDLALGFEGYPWHTHGDILAAVSGLPISEAVKQFIEALLNGEAVVAVASVDGVVQDVWIADRPIEPDRYKPENETIVYRLWDGSVRWVDGPSTTPPTPFR